MNSDLPRPRPKKSRAALPKDAAENAGQPDLTFEQALTALEGVVQDLEQGELGLSDSLSRYEQGVQYLKQCYGQLAQAERRVELLKQLDPQGQARTTPFDEAAMSLEEKAASRGARRSTEPTRASPPRRPPEGGAVDESAGLF